MMIQETQLDPTLIREGAPSPSGPERIRATVIA